MDLIVVGTARLAGRPDCPTFDHFPTASNCPTNHLPTKHSSGCAPALLVQDSTRHSWIASQMLCSPQLRHTLASHASQEGCCAVDMLVLAVRRAARARARWHWRSQIVGGCGQETEQLAMGGDSGRGGGSGGTGTPALDRHTKSDTASGCDWVHAISY